MTVIAGAVGKNGVVLGADRMASSCIHKEDSGPKIVQREDWAFANTGNVRTIQIMEKMTRGKKVRTRDDILELAQNLFEELRGKGLGAAEEGEMPQMNSAFLIATVEGLFSISAGFSVYEYKDFAADGIGEEYALGVMFDGWGKVDAVELVERAIAAANALNPHCGGGPDIVRISKIEKPYFVGELKLEKGQEPRK